MRQDYLATLFLAAFLMIPTVVSVFGQTETKKYNVVEKAKLAKEFIEKTSKIQETADLNIQCGYNIDILLCLRFLEKLEADQDSLKKISFLLKGIQIILEENYADSKKICEAIRDKVSINPRNEPKTALFCLTSTYSETTSNTKKYTSENLLALEKEFRAAVAKNQFVVGIREGHIDSTSISYGAFIARHPKNKKILLITAGHVAAELNDTKLTIFLPRKVLHVEADFKISEVLDLAYAELPNNLSLPQPGILIDNTHDLIPEETPLAALCNPHYFKIATRTGFYTELNKETNYLGIRFPGIGAENGCSGGAIVDRRINIRGIIIRRHGQIIQAVPVNVFLKFYNNR